MYPGFNPSGGSSYGATNLGSNYGAPSGQLPPGAGLSYAPSAGAPAYQPAVHRQPAAASGPVSSAYRSSSVSRSPASFTPSGTYIQPAPQGKNHAFVVAQFAQFLSCIIEVYVHLIKSLTP